MAKAPVEHMPEEEKKAWDDLYWYVHTNIMGYNHDQKLSKKMILRLKGLPNSKFIANRYIKSESNYSFKVILLTFKFCYPEIQNALATKNFDDEDHKFNYILKIIESNLNNVYMRMKNAEKAKEKTESAETSSISYDGAEYKKKTKETPSRLNSLW